MKIQLPPSCVFVGGTVPAALELGATVVSLIKQIITSLVHLQFSRPPVICS